MADIHDSTILLGNVELADDVFVGPGCVFDATAGTITIGAGSRLVGGVYLYGPLTIGLGNTLYPSACLGFAPQSRSYDPRSVGCGVAIGDDNTFREGVTVHRAMTDEGPTTIGDHNYFMVNSHAGHDTRVGNYCTLANGTLLAGHAIVDDHATLSGNSAVHQFSRVGRGAMLSGSSGALHDVPPFFTLTAIDVAGSLNMVGMRRLQMSGEQIDTVRWVYKTLYRRGLPPPAALDQLRQRADEPLVAEYIEFIETSRRGLVRGRDHPNRPPVA